MAREETIALLERSTPQRIAEVRPVAPTGERLVSLDAYRGFVMLAMISAGLGLAKISLAHDPQWHWFFKQFDHAPWEGCTAWDLIQPSFMFIVGLAMPLAFARRQQQGQSWLQQFGHVCMRCLLLILIGIFLDSYSAQRPVVQFIRVLQQIAFGYFVAFLVLRAGPRVQAALAVLLLLGHTLAFLVYGWVNDLNPWGMTNNVGLWLDRWANQALDHIEGMSLMPVSRGWYVTFNAVSSAATILFGVLCGELLRSRLSRGMKFGILLLAAAFGLAGGLALTWEVPMIKRIWTASFGIYAAGWTCLLMALFYGVVDGLGWKAWSFPLVVVGMNSIAAYVLAGTVGGNFKRIAGLFLDGPLAGNRDAHQVAILASALVFEWLVLWWFYRRRLFFKV
jgi:heparan-alpha-glucosaminide N-acetyltransferase